MVAGGYRAIDTLRLEKGYRVWGADITPDETPDEAGLGFAVRLDKGDSSAARRCWPRRERRAGAAAVLPGAGRPAPVALGNEPVRVGGEVAGRVTTGGYGYAVERSIAYAYLPAAPRRGRPAVEVEVFGEWVAAEVAAEPLWTRAASGFVVEGLLALRVPGPSRSDVVGALRTRSRS